MKVRTLIQALLEFDLDKEFSVVLTNDKHSIIYSHSELMKVLVENGELIHLMVFEMNTEKLYSEES